MSVPDRPYAVPRSTFVWLALLVAVVMLPRAVGRTPAARAEGGETLTASAFQKYVSAESLVRSASGFTGWLDVTETLPVQNRMRMLDEAVELYRDLLDESDAPNLRRRMLILENALGRNPDTRLLRSDLPRTLEKAGAAPRDVDAEKALWHALYVRRRVAPSDVPRFERRIRAMRLRTLEDRTLRDLHEAASDRQKVAHFERRERARGQAFVTRTAALSLTIGGGLLAGFVFLFLFLRAARRGAWHRVARVATAPQRLGWGDLIDAFVFYLFLYRGVGFVASVLLARWDGATVQQRILLAALVQIGTGLGALVYLAGAARRRGATLADVGLTTRGGLWADVGYGVAGYCAILPLVLGLGRLSAFLFRNSPNTAPNPVLPLLAGDQDTAARLLIFVMVALAAPFFEELFFRGALFTGLRVRWGWVAAALASAAVFAVAHPVQDWLPILGLGFGFAAMREMRQSLVPGIVAHLIQNGLAFLFLATLFGR